MGQVQVLITVLFVAAACAYGLFRLAKANREAGLARERAEAEAKRRREQEKELLERLGRIKEKKDDLQAAQDAIGKDPERAAKVVSKMMRSKD